MTRSSRTWLVLSVTAVVAVLGLSACGQTNSSAGAAADNSGYTDLSWDAQALQTLGFAPADVTLAGDTTDAVTPSASPSPGAHAGGGKAARIRHRLVKFGFGKRLEHGQATVQTDEGTKTVVVQRGAVTAITATSVTVKSADGFTLTWTFGPKFVAIKDRAKIDPSTVAVGTSVGVAGAMNGNETDARLLVVAKN
jgi:hypothetical protein